MEKSRSVILFIIDGLRPDGIIQARTPNIDSMIESGAYSFKAHSVIPSHTLAGITSMFLGSNPKSHGLTETWTPKTPPFPSIIDTINSAEKKVAAFYNWEPLIDFCKPESISASFYRKNVHNIQGSLIIAKDAACYLVENPTDLAVIYFGQTDHVGHYFGWMSKPYLEAIEKADKAIGNVINALKKTDNFKDTFFIVTSDHGGHTLEKPFLWMDKELLIGSHGYDHDKEEFTYIKEDIIIPWIISGHQLRHPGKLELKDIVNIADTAPTIAYLLKADPPKQWTGKIIEEIKQLF
jgi:predicted AlkP superfamily pyrophosphatase or phosphodiesterase